MYAVNPATYIKRLNFENIFLSLSPRSLSWCVSHGRRYAVLCVHIRFGDIRSEFAKMINVKFIAHRNRKVHRNGEMVRDNIVHSNKWINVNDADEINETKTKLTHRPLSPSPFPTLYSSIAFENYLSSPNGESAKK